MTRIPHKEVRQVLAAIREHGGMKPAARKLGRSFGWVQRRFRRAVELGLAEPGVVGQKDWAPVIKGRVDSPHKIQRVERLPKGKQIRRYILTSAQNNTYINEAAWDALQALAKHYDAEIFVGTFSYQKAKFGNKAVKRGTKKRSDADALWYDDRIEDYIVDEPVLLAPGLQWVGNFNRLPTTAHPLAGFESHTGRNSGIFPHAKLAMKSVPSMLFHATKFNYTTGTVTQRNYLQKAAGIKAEFHHCYGGLLVEVNKDGDWWVRQLNVDSDGTLYDLTVRVEGNSVIDYTQEGHASYQVEAINWGDIHVADHDEVNADACWHDEDSMIDVLRPKHQFFHDLVDFKARNGHHVKRNLPQQKFAAYVSGYDSVEDELMEVNNFLALTGRPFCLGHVVPSNHNEFLDEFIRLQGFKWDPVNARFYLAAANYLWEQLEKNPRRHPNMTKWALEHVGLPSLPAKLQPNFIDRDDSYVICPDANGGIECALHGDKGPNGSRGSAQALAKMGRKVNMGHTHSAEILDGVYVAGTSSRLDLDYVSGPSSWSHSHIVTYPNGKRAIITVWKGKWRA